MAREQIDRLSNVKMVSDLGRWIRYGKVNFLVINSLKAIDDYVCKIQAQFYPTPPPPKEIVIGPI